MITACITSYNRFPLLEKCITTLLQQECGLITKIIIGEDSENIGAKTSIERLIQSYERNYDKIELQFNEHNLGQPGNIDKLYSKVKTPYILHIEDDYVFDGNSNFIQNSINILEERSDIQYIWIRKLNNYNESHGLGDGRILFGELKQTQSGVQYRDFTYTSIHLSWMPHISRLADYNSAYPNGYKSLILNGERSSQAEGVCGKVMAWKYKAATLEDGACSTYNHFANSTYH